MPYAHANGEQCHNCDTPAARIVAARPLCADHFANLITHCHNNTKRHILTPHNLTPDGFTAWAALLDHGIYIGVITPDEAAHVWNNAQEFAA